MQALSFEEFKSHAIRSKHVSIFEEISVKHLTSSLIYKILSEKFGDGIIFENLQTEKNNNNYSFLCFEPINSLTMDKNDSSEPLITIRDLQSQLNHSTREDVSHLITTAAGFFTYDAIRCFEDIPDRHASNSDLPLLLFNFYRLSLAFDHQKQTILISILVESDDQLYASYQKAKQNISTIISILMNCEPNTDVNRDSIIEKQPIETDIDDNSYINLVNEAKKYITQGDAFQIVLSRCFKRPYTVSPLDIYQTLCKVSPAPYMFYFPTKFGVFLGASPEKLISVKDRKISINPIAGTRKRTNDNTKEIIESALLNDKKEIAEHMMLVDLARNDIGAVSEPNSIEIIELLKVKHYSHISHITSTINGTLQEPYDALDAFAAAFPAGTLSGAPKIRAMQIIDELETSRRGLYGGAICRFDMAGNLDTCIAIRMAKLQNGIATIRTGAGIVYDSNPVSEAEETQQKARAILDAIAKAHGE